MHDENCCSGVFGRTRAPVFSLFPPCYSPVIRHKFLARKVIGIRALAEKAGENALYQVKFAVPALSAPAENAGFPRASPPHLLQIRCICSKTAIARRPPPAQSGPARFSLAANPLQMQPDAHRIAARSRGRVPTSG